MQIRKGMKIWFKERGKERRGKVVKEFDGIYYQGKKKVGKRKFVELMVGKSNYVLLLSEFNKRCRKRLL